LEGKGVGGCTGGDNRGYRRKTEMAQEQVAPLELPEPESLKERVAAYERKLILEALRLARGNQRQAAAALGCLPTTLNEKMRRLGLRGLRVWSASEPRPSEPTVVGPAADWHRRG
jgi:DNA-binding NtrC family response regulator